MAVKVSVRVAVLLAVGDMVIREVLVNVDVAVAELVKVGVEV